LKEEETKRQKSEEDDAPNYRRFGGKRVLITGAGRGIGRAIALALAREGASIAVGYVRNTKTAEEVAERVRGYGGDAFLVKANVGTLDGIEKLFATVREHWDYLDIFVSNAVLAALRGVTEFTERHWNITFDTNAKAYLFAAQHAVKLMQGRKGKIIAISSMGSQRCLPGYAVLGAAKSSLETLTRYLAFELAGQGVSVNAVSGGPVDTEALKTFPYYEQLVSETTGRTPLGRIGQPEDIAKVVAFLASDDSEWIQGQTIIADGGLSLW
jgi:NAD(P)-dependent dehydrogenase (short-subunit alcohol dehydrogenase family)